jgi:hypothetical protein
MSIALAPSRAIGAVFALLLIIASVILAVPPAPAGASSHREAPLISRDPQADNTDLYAFRSPDSPDTITIVANYIPLEEPNGGPNFVSFGDDVRYEIHIDNDGDAKDDITYQFNFKSKVQNPNTFLYATGPIVSPTDPNYNFQQSYRVTKVTRRGRGDNKRDDDERYGRGGSTRSAIIASGVVPPVNIGPRSTPNYDAIAAQAVVSLADGTKIFAGQRDDPFFVDLGSIFDLGGLRPFNTLHAIPLDPASYGGTGIDGVSGYNTHAIIMQIPIAQLTKDSKGPDATTSPVLGIYASASRQSIRVLDVKGTSYNLGPWVQVSRLGNPLINEVIIPSGMKDYWNSQSPSSDAEFEPYYLKPELAGIVNLLYGSALQPVQTTNRTDLSLILLQGVPGVNNPGTGVKADLLRLNVAVAADIPVGQGNPLSVINDPDKAEVGFPNGRRLEDDVTDIELKAVAQGYGAYLNGAFGLPNLSPNNLVGDGVDANDRAFTTTFPYLATPHAGYDSTLHGGQRTPF